MTPNTDSAGPSSPNPGRKEQEHPDGSLGARSGAALHNGRYRLRQKLGQGGMGAVYLADDASLPGRQVAVKENLNTTAATQRLFKREALLLARLRHPNLPQVTDFFVEPDGRQYLVMDYVPGENLGQLLRAAKGPLPAAEALAIAEQVMRALAYMHTWRDPESGHVRPVIHRDIKPANIKRTPEGHVVLVDFGIAKLDSGEGEHTALSARAMTPGYAPLEQYSGGTDARSDIYALGATLYALLSGKAPPTATDKAAAGARPAAQLMPGLKALPPSAAKVIERAMQSSPADRFQTVAEMYQALYGRPLATGANALAAAATAVGGPAAPPARRNPWLAAAFAVAVLLLAVGLGWLLFNSGGQGTAGIPLTPTAVVAGGAASDPPTELPAPTVSPDDAQASANSVEADSLAEGAALIAALLENIPDTPMPAPATPTRKPTSTPLPTLTPRPTFTPTPAHATLRSKFFQTPTPVAHPDSVIADTTDLLKENPNDVELLRLRAAAYAQKGDFLSSSRLLTKVISLDPTNVAAYVARGDTYLAMVGFDDRAFADYSKAIELEPDEPLSYYIRASAYRKRGDMQSAIQDYAKALEIDPDSDMAYFGRGVAYAGMGEMTMGMAHFVKAIDIDPTNAAPYAALCWFLSLQRQPNLAMDYCEEAISLDNSAEYFDSRGLAHAILGNYPAAITDFQVFVDWSTKNYPADPTLKKMMQQRMHWIDVLQRGESPFTPILLKALESEYR